MRQPVATVSSLLSLIAVAACAGAAGTSSSGVSRMNAATAERLAVEGAIPTKAAGAGESGGDVGDVK